MFFQELKVFLLLFTIRLSCSTIDINLAEYQYIADHLTKRECYQLLAALHFNSFELPKDLNAAERRIPEGIPCIDLLLHWNSAPREGRGQTHVEVCHRLIQIGREDLAKWLSKTVFHEISRDLKAVFTTVETKDAVEGQFHLTEVYPNEKKIDEAAWWTLDSVLEIVIVMGLATLIFVLFFACFLRCSTRNKEY